MAFLLPQGALFSLRSVLPEYEPRDETSRQVHRVPRRREGGADADKDGVVVGCGSVFVGLLCGRRWDWGKIGDLGVVLGCVSTLVDRNETFCFQGCDHVCAMVCWSLFSSSSWLLPPM